MPVRRHEVERDDVIGRAAVPHGVVAAGVVADRAADGRAGLAGRVGGEGERAVRRQLHVFLQVREDDAGFDDGSSGGRVDGPHLIHVPGEVEHHSPADRVARE